MASTEEPEDPFDLDDISLCEENYYTFLNLSDQATNEEINNAYRRFSRIYHPDKHVEPARKKQAELLFSKAKKAYEVLIDPQKRAIYDTVGSKGLETDGWEVVHRTKTAREIREEYERLAHEQEEKRLQQRTNPKGSIVVNVNATDLFDAYEFDQFPQLEVSGMSISQSIESPLTSKDTVILAGQLQTQNGTGTQGVTCAWRRIISPQGWAEFEVGAGSGLLFNLRGYRTISKRMFCNAQTTCVVTPRGLRPGLQTTIGYQLDRHLMGYLVWKAGIQSGMTTSVVWDVSEYHVVLSAQLGIPHSYVLFNVTRKFGDEVKLRTILRAGTFGFNIEYGCEKKLTRHTSAFASVSVGVPSGVSLKVRLLRGQQVYSFPILLSEEILPAPIIYATVVPIVAYFTVKTFVVTPYIKRQKEKAASKAKESGKERLEQMKREARFTVSLMQETYMRIREREMARKGLVIVKALYGKQITDENITEDLPDVIEVTIPVQCLVDDSKLILPATSKAQLPGFYDPCFGDKKVLYVQYKFRDTLHIVTIVDEEHVKLPRQTHAVA